MAPAYHLFGRAGNALKATKVAMTPVDRSNRILATGLVVSLGVHVVIGTGFVQGLVRVERAAPEPPADTGIVFELEDPERPDEVRPKPVQLGIEDGREDAAAWLGFKEPTEHAATKSEVAQSAMTISPGGPESEIESGLAAAVEASAQARESSPVDLKLIEPVREPAPTVEREPPASEPGDPVAAEGAGPGAFDAVRRLTEDLSARAAEAMEALRVLGAEALPAEASAQPARASGGGETGIASDKESMATSLKEAITVIPGRVAAGRGLELITRKPKWSITTLSTRRPVNPVVVATFRRDGTVVDAKFLNDGKRVLSTGYEDVDEPLINAIYQWRAKGPPLDELKGPDDVLTVTIRVILIH